MNYYASGACTRTRNQNQPFLEKNRVRALSSASSCKGMTTPHGASPAAQLGIGVHQSLESGFAQPYHLTL